MVLCALSFVVPSGAQTFEEYRKGIIKEFEDYREQKRTEFEMYRSRLNKEYAERLSSDWRSFGVQNAKERPEIPGPKKPLKQDGEIPESSITLPTGLIHPELQPSVSPPISEPLDSTTKKKDISFDFFGSRCFIGRLDLNIAPEPTSSSVASVWKSLSDSGMAASLTDDCLLIRKQLRLCDWAYLLLVEKASETLFPSNKNAATLLAVWLLCQSGYDVLPGFVDGQIRLLYSADREIYGVCCAHIGKKDYYIKMPSDTIRSLESVSIPFSSENVNLRMVMDQIPLFPDSPTDAAYCSAQWSAAPPFEVIPNSHLVDFMRSYPLVDWEVYGASALSAEVRNSVFAALSIIVEDMVPLDAVNTILEYTQRGFSYMSDGDQFGEEKPFFIEENFVYPFNDCEDRAILFCRLVHEILGLDTVYLHYPSHLCAAVDVSGIETGYNVNVNGRKYWICDPCYIPSKVGNLAPPYRKSVPEIISITMP